MGLPGHWVGDLRFEAWSWGLDYDPVTASPIFAFGVCSLYPRPSTYTTMASLCAGFYREHPVNIVVDPAVPTSKLSRAFVHRFHLPATVVRLPDSSYGQFASGPVILPSRTGVYASTLRLSIGDCEHEVVLGQDWFAAAGCHFVDGYL